MNSQWKWKTGHRWNIDNKTGRRCIGCGEQEEFYGCSDISILAKGATLGTTKEISRTRFTRTVRTSSRTTPLNNITKKVELYGQCDGIGYFGVRECVNGTKCFKQSDYYSQCLKNCPPTWGCF